MSSSRVFSKYSRVLTSALSSINVSLLRCASLIAARCCVLSYPFHHNPSLPSTNLAEYDHIYPLPTSIRAYHPLPPCTSLSCHFHDAVYVGHPCGQIR